MIKVADGQGVELEHPKHPDHLQIHRLDEHGIDVTLAKAQLRPKVLVLGGALPDKHRRLWVCRNPGSPKRSIATPT
jgi:hypothetical protein